MNKKMILTIAIPTYNRCDLLCQSLDSVLEQIEDNIEILVSDNASTDDTQTIMKKYCEKYNIRYFRNSENLGMDKNFLNCFQKANGEYIQFLSDDDILLPGALQKIIYLLKTEEPAYINLNSFTYSTKIFNPNERKAPRIQLKESGDLITYDKNLIMEYIGVYVTYISATILKMSKFKQIKNPEQYFGTHFLHAHLVFRILSEENNKMIITKAPYLAAKNNNSGGFNLYDVWVKQYKKLLLQTGFQSGFQKSQMKKIFIDDMKGFIKDSILKYSVEDNHYEMNHKWILFINTYMYPSLWFRVWPYAILPRPILNHIYIQKRKKK